jgi:hypothetical protein
VREGEYVLTNGAHSAGITKTFQPDDGFDCLLMQCVFHFPRYSPPRSGLTLMHRNKCDATVPFADISSDEVAIAHDLSGLKWIGNSTSYICFSEVVAAKRFIRISRLKAGGSAIVHDE